MIAKKSEDLTGRDKSHFLLNNFFGHHSILGLGAFLDISIDISVSTHGSICKILLQYFVFVINSVWEILS
jgi:hypothetical protein